LQVLDTRRVASGGAPLLAAQLTQLGGGGGGSILAVACSHAVMDATTAAVFMQGWSRLYRQEVAAAAPGGQEAAQAASGASRQQGPRLLTRFLLDPSVAPAAVLAAEGLPADHPLQCYVPAAPGWRAALGAAAGAYRQLRGEIRALPVSTTDLVNLLWHVPEADLAALKALCSAGAGAGAGVGAGGGGGGRVSANDAVSALVWASMCHLRGRPLPGEAAGAAAGPAAGGGAACWPWQRRVVGGGRVAPTAGAAAAAGSGLQQGKGGAAAAAGFLGLAIDLRANCPDLQLAPDALGNLSWSLNVRNAAAGPGTDQQQGGSELRRFEAALAAGARLVRGALLQLRGTPAVGRKVLGMVEAQNQAPASSKVRLLAASCLPARCRAPSSCLLPAHPCCPCL
jgi:hypothetical protein